MTTIDPEQERQRLAKVYAEMADGELEKLVDEAGELTDEARIALKAEVERRGMHVEYQAEARPPDPEHLPLVTVAQFRDVPEAMLAKGMLESAGIECFLADQNLVHMDWFYSNAIGGMRLQVKEQDAAIAEEMLNQPIPDNFMLDAAQRYQQPRCPKCQSLDIEFEGVDRAIGMASAWAFSVPFPLRSNTWKCNACGSEWKEKEGG